LHQSDQLNLSKYHDKTDSSISLLEIQRLDVAV